VQKKSQNEVKNKKTFRICGASMMLNESRVRGKTKEEL
jgi:hypothetical protein